MFDSMVRDNNDAGKREGGTATIRIKRLLALASELDRENLEGYSAWGVNSEKNS